MLFIGPYHTPTGGHLVRTLQLIHGYNQTEIEPPSRQVACSLTTLRSRTLNYNVVLYFSSNVGFGHHCWPICSYNNNPYFLLPLLVEATESEQGRQTFTETKLILKTDEGKCD